MKTTCSVLTCTNICHFELSKLIIKTSVVFKIIFLISANLFPPNLLPLTCHNKNYFFASHFTAWTRSLDNLTVFFFLMPLGCSCSMRRLAATLGGLLLYDLGILPCVVLKRGPATKPMALILQHGFQGKPGCQFKMKWRC